MADRYSPSPASEASAEESAIFDIPGGLEVERVSERRVGEGAGSQPVLLREGES
jgi:hypothetical protein